MKVGIVGEGSERGEGVCAHLAAVRGGPAEEGTR